MTVTENKKESLTIKTKVESSPSGTSGLTEPLRCDSAAGVRALPHPAPCPSVLTANGLSAAPSDHCTRLRVRQLRSATSLYYCRTLCSRVLSASPVSNSIPHQQPWPSELPRDPAPFSQALCVLWVFWPTEHIHSGTSPSPDISIPSFIVCHGSVSSSTSFKVS